MHETTKVFLDAVINRKALAPDGDMPSCAELRKCCGEGMREAFELQDLFDQVEAAAAAGKEDAMLVGRLGEVESCIASMERLQREFRDRMQELAKCRASFAATVERVVKPMLEKGGAELTEGAVVPTVLP